MRKPTIPWEAYKEQLLELKYKEKKSLTEINKILAEKLGKSVTNARLSQIYKQWKVAELQTEIQQKLDVLDQLDKELRPNAN